MATHDFYTESNGYIPDVKLTKIAGDERDVSAYFTWRDKPQWLAMSKDNHYGDNCWLVVKTDYTEDFQEWLDEELGGYDSLETMFASAIPDTTYEIIYE
jgi:hypothetical protein